MKTKVGLFLISIALASAPMAQEAQSAKDKRGTGREKVGNGEKVGKGGSGSEAQLAVEQANLIDKAKKIRDFFKANQAEMNVVFPEFTPKALIDKINDITSMGRPQIDVTNRKLTDMNGVPNRTCLNYEESVAIECNYGELQKIKHDAKAMYLLVLHEVLGLMNVEKNSPRNPKHLQGYKVSKRFMPYVTESGELRMPAGQRQRAPAPAASSKIPPERQRAIESLVEKNDIEGLVAFINQSEDKRGEALLVTALASKANKNYDKNAMVERFWAIATGPDTPPPYNGAIEKFVSLKWTNELISFLESHGKSEADVNRALVLAISERNLKMVGRILSMKPDHDLNISFDNKGTPLTVAIGACDPEIVQTLVEWGADVNLPTKWHNNALEAALATYKHIEKEYHGTDKQNGPATAFYASRLNRAEDVLNYLESLQK